MSYQMKSSGEYRDRTYYRMLQTYKNKPVYGKAVTVACDSEGNVTGTTENTEEIIREDMEKSLSEEEARKLIYKVMQEQYSCREDSIDCSDAEEMYYISEGTAIPAYSYNIAGQTEDHELTGRKVLVSAADGKILSEQSTIYYVQEEGRYEGQKNVQPIRYENDNGQCTMVNTEDSITVNQPNDRNGFFWYRPEEHHVESWDAGAENPDRSAVDAMANIMRVVDYYDDPEGGNYQGMWGTQKTDLGGNPFQIYVNVVNLAINEEVLRTYWNNAFYWVTPQGEHMIAFTRRTNGQAQYSADLDVVAHEFGHSIYGRLVEPTEENESGSLNEGYADILGLCAESYVWEQPIDWEMTGFRTLSNPAVSHYSELDSAGSDPHVRGQLMTYAVYLMGQGFQTDEFSKEESRIIEREQVMNLAISTLYQLPSDADYVKWREVVERTAEALYQDGDLTKGQRECVTLALDTVGIPATDIGGDETGEEEEKPRSAELLKEYLEDTLIPEYGVMPTDEIKKPYSSDGIWLEPKDLRGILSATIGPFGDDGLDRMLIIRATCDGTATAQNADKGEVKLCMEMYEAKDEVSCAAVKVFEPCGSYRWNVHDVQTGFFTYTNNGTRYIGIDSNFGMNESISTLAVYQYRNNEFQYVKGVCRQRQGGGYEAVLSADTEPEAGYVTFGATYTDDKKGWKVLEDYDAESAGYDQERTKQKIGELNELYSQQLQELGLIQKDTRIIWNYESSDYPWDTTTENIYQSDSGDLRTMAVIAGIYNYDREKYLFRKDIEKTMDEYR